MYGIQELNLAFVIGMKKLCNEYCTVCIN